MKRSPIVEQLAQRVLNEVAEPMRMPWEPGEFDRYPTSPYPQPGPGGPMPMPAAKPGEVPGPGTGWYRDPSTGRIIFPGLTPGTLDRPVTTKPTTWEMIQDIYRAIQYPTTWPGA